jgi:hypothetical protein
MFCASRIRLVTPAGCMASSIVSAAYPGFGMHEKAAPDAMRDATGGSTPAQGQVNGTRQEGDAARSAARSTSRMTAISIRRSSAVAGTDCG